MTASIGPTMTASSGSTRAIADGPKWPRFKQAAKRKTRSRAGPVRVDMDIQQKGGGSNFKASVWGHLEAS